MADVVASKTPRRLLTSCTWSRPKAISCRAFAAIFRYVNIFQRAIRFRDFNDLIRTPGRMVTGHREIVVADQLGVFDIQVQLVQQRIRVFSRVFVQRRHGLRLPSDQPAFRHPRISNHDQGESSEFLLPSGLYMVTGFERRTPFDNRNRQFAKS